MEKEYIRRIKQGEVFIYPTDTIYGLGCDATNFISVARIREIKKRDSKPFSIIAPGKAWIRKNCFVDEKAEKWIKKLPGQYTLILKLKNKNSVASNVNHSKDSIGIRIPNHWFSKIIEKAGKPFVTTSVNFSGENYATSIESVREEIKDSVDIIIDGGELKSRPSVVVNLIGEKEEIIKR